MGGNLGLAKATGFDKHGSLTACMLLGIRQQQRTKSNKRLSVSSWRAKLPLIYYSSVSHLIIIVNLFLISPKVGSREWTLEGHGRVQCMPSTTSTLFALQLDSRFLESAPIADRACSAHLSSRLYCSAPLRFSLYWHSLSCTSVLSRLHSFIQSFSHTWHSWDNLHLLWVCVSKFLLFWAHCCCCLVLCSSVTRQILIPCKISVWRTSEARTMFHIWTAMPARAAHPSPPKTFFSPDFARLVPDHINHGWAIVLFRNA